MLSVGLLFLFFRFVLFRFFFFSFFLFLSFFLFFLLFLFFLFFLLLLFLFHLRLGCRLCYLVHADDEVGVLNSYLFHRIVPIESLALEDHFQSLGCHTFGLLNFSLEDCYLSINEECTVSVG